MRTVVNILLVISVAFVVLTPARANLLTGQTVEVTYLFPDTNTVFAAPVDVVGPAGALSFYAGFVDIALSDTNILITADRNAQVNNVSFDGLRFVDLNGNIPDFTSVSLDGATTYSGFTASRISAGANTIFVNVADLPGLQGQVISVDIGAAAVPEPGSWILAGAGLLAILALLRRAAA